MGSELLLWSSSFGAVLKAPEEDSTFRRGRLEHCPCEVPGVPGASFGVPVNGRKPFTSMNGR